MHPVHIQLSVLSLLVIGAAVVTAQTDVLIDVYPNCFTSVWSVRDIKSSGGYMTYGCKNIPSGSIQVSVDNPNADWLNMYLFDEPNYNQWKTGKPSGCYCEDICFVQGSQGSGKPTRKTGKCVVSTAGTQNIYIAVVNLNRILSSGMISLSGWYHPDSIPISSSTGGWLSSTGSIVTDWGSQWAGTYTADSTCSRSSCCCIVGSFKIIKMSDTSVQLNGNVAGTCPSQSTSLNFYGLTGLSWTGPILGLGESYTFRHTSTGITATNNEYPICNGNANAGNIDSVATGGWVIIILVAAGCLVAVIIGCCWICHRRTKSSVDHEFVNLAHESQARVALVNES